MIASNVLTNVALFARFWASQTHNAVKCFNDKIEIQHLHISDYGIYTNEYDEMYHNNFSHFIYITFQWTSIILNRYIKSPTLNMPKILFMHEFRECLCMRLWGTTKQNIEFVIFAVYINNVFALLAHVQKITTLVSCVYNYIESEWTSILGANIFFVYGKS